jgi:two-component system response regulator NreC
MLLLSDFLRDRALQDGAVARLNEQERKILLLAAEGYNSTEIGKKLFLSPKTIDSYRSRLMRQLGLSRRSDLVHMALHSGLLKAEAAGYRSAPDFRQRTSGSALPRFSAPSV